MKQNRKQKQEKKLIIMKKTIFEKEWGLFYFFQTSNVHSNKQKYKS